MLSAFLLIYYMNGSIKLEPITVVGPDWPECQAFAVQAAIGRKDYYKDARFILPYCM